MIEETPKCPICNQPPTSYRFSVMSTSARVECQVCGKYEILESAALRSFYFDPDKKYILSASIRAQYENGLSVYVEDLDRLEDSVSRPDGPIESIDRILIYVDRKASTLDQCVPVDRQNDYPIAFARNEAEFAYLLARACQLNYLETPRGTPEYRLTIDGWKRLSELRQYKVKSNQAFVAMWFDESLDEAWGDGLKPALTETGYVPIRIDLTQHNEKICDRIIAEIRKSALLIADFTGQRGGVYFESGFAMGMGIPVIWTCRDTDIDNLHFDTRQYNHIVWRDAVDLKEKLIDRIDATLPNRQVTEVTL